MFLFLLWQFFILKVKYAEEILGKWLTLEGWGRTLRYDFAKISIKLHEIEKILFSFGGAQ